MIKDINDFYFTMDEFDLFSPENATGNTRDLRDRRKNLQQKMLDLNQELYPILNANNLNLAVHKSPEHITSLCYPCSHNKFRVDWLGIRYGRNSRDIKDLEEIINNIPHYQRTLQDKKLGFQKYACLQVNICYTGVEIGIFHSVPDFAVDRMFMHEHLSDNEFQEAVIEAIRNIRFYGYKWTISDNLETHEFDFDNNRPEDFIDFYRKYDKDGCWSSMLKHFPRYDDKIDKYNLINTSLEIISQLKPLYELLIWKRRQS